MTKLTNYKFIKEEINLGDFKSFFKLSPFMEENQIKRINCTTACIKQNAFGISQDYLGHSFTLCELLICEVAALVFVILALA